MKWINNLIKKCGKSLWHTLAVIIVFLVAGPEIIISMELMAVVELVGASTFVIAYFSGVRLYFEKPIALFVNIFLKCTKFESSSYFFLPTTQHIKSMPSLIVHAIPEKLIMFIFLVLLIYSFAMLIFRVA